MRLILAISSLFLLSSCVVRHLEVTPVAVSGDAPIEVRSPVKAHLVDGSTIVFPDGITVADNVVRGNGQRYDLTLQNSVSVTEIPIDEIVAMESYQTPVNVGATAVGSVGTTVGVTAAAVLGIMLVFGSCPTVYSLEADSAVLEAELFSYSIAPAFQMRDIDRLGIPATTSGYFDLEVRNEMLETHYIDHLEVLEVVHGPDQKAYPDKKGRPLVAGNLISPTVAIDQAGRNVLDAVSEADGVAWSATEERLATVTEDDFLNHLDFEFNVPNNSGDVALVLRLRNSLLNTVLLYDVMLQEQSFSALDWMGQDLSRLRNKIETGLWYRKHMGLTISVWDNGRYRKVKRIGDQGPIAWSERAVSLPGSGDGSLKVRFSFVADNWRFDRVALALDSERGNYRTISVGSSATSDGDRPDIVGYLARADEEYLITRPGESVSLRFNVGEELDGTARSFFLASEGYYIEWMRSAWLSQEHRKQFDPGTDALLRALNLYAQKRDNMREQFDAIKIETR